MTHRAIFGGNAEGEGRGAGCPSHYQVTLSQIHSQRCYSSKGRRLCEQLRLTTSQLASRDYPVIESEEVLLERLRSGDSTAFEELFLRHYAAVYRVVYGVVTNAQEAEDLAQETFTALYRQPPRLDGSGALGAWLYRVAVNRAYNVLRGNRRLQRGLERVEVEPEQQSDPQDEYLRREERERVRAALARLPERTAKLLLLRHAGLAYAEIAAALQVAPGSVGTLLARAERAFVAAYEREGDSDVGSQ